MRSELDHGAGGAEGEVGVEEGGGEGVQVLGEGEDVGGRGVRGEGEGEDGQEEFGREGEER